MIEAVPFTAEEMARIDRFLADYAFRPLGWEPGQRNYMWPIDEYLARRKHGPRVAARISSLNPNGKPEGAKPRGWNPHPHISRWEIDSMPIHVFVRRYGADLYRKIPRQALIRQGHRKAVAMAWIVDGCPLEIAHG